MSDKKVILVYIGDGSALVGVPAMDLTAAMIAESGLTSDELVATGLYEIQKGKPAPDSDKAGKGGTENK